MTASWFNTASEVDTLQGSTEATESRATCFCSCQCIDNEDAVLEAYGWPSRVDLIGTCARLAKVREEFRRIEWLRDRDIHGSFRICLTTCMSVSFAAERLRSTIAAVSMLIAIAQQSWKSNGAASARNPRRSQLRKSPNRDQAART